MAVLKIREASPAKGGDAAEFAGVVCLDDGPEYAIRLRNPFSLEEEERLEWYFEEHLTYPFLHGVKAREAAQSITRYGEALFNQVFAANHHVYALYARVRDRLSELRIEIEGSPAFHALHWERSRIPSCRGPSPSTPCWSAGGGLRRRCRHKSNRPRHCAC